MKKGRKVKCDICNDIFFTIYHTQKRCSDECMKKGIKTRQRKTNNKKTGIYKKCIVCGKEFEVRYTNKKQKLCSKKCVNKHNCGPKKDLKAKAYKQFLQLRFLVFRRDGFRCRYCGKTPLENTAIKLHCDHIVPKSKGGIDELKNLVTSCELCNLGKGDVLLEARQVEKIKNRSIM